MPTSSSRLNTLPQIKPSMNSARAKSSIHFNLLQIHKSVLITIDQIEKEIMEFGEVLMKKQRSSVEDVINYLKYIENQLNLSDEIIDVQFLYQLFQHNSTNYGKNQCREYYDLKLITEKLTRINHLLSNVPEKINDVFENKIIPFCISLIDEIGNNEVPPITQEYEDLIKDFRQKLNLSIKQLNDLRLINDMTNKHLWLSVRDYIERHDGINQEILTWCKIILDICNLAKSWIDIDRTYPSKLQDTVFWLRSKRQDLTHKIHALKRKQMEMEAERLVIEKSIQRKSCAVIQAQSDIGHYTARDRNVLVAIDKLQNEISQMKEARQICLTDRSRSTTAKTIQSYNEHLMYYDNAIEDAQKRLKRLNEISDQFVMEQQKNSESAKYYKESVSTEQQDYDRIELDIATCQSEIEEILEIINSIEKQVVIVQKIRSLKIEERNAIQTTSLYQPGASKSYNDDIDDFFKLCAPVIGKKWKEVYKKLPFDPARDWKQKDLDVEAIDINNRRLEPDFVRLAYLSLQKWRRLSTAASIVNLTKVLRKMGLAQYVLPMKKTSSLQMLNIP